jgi:hypothetical protein
MRVKSAVNEDRRKTIREMSGILFKIWILSEDICCRPSYETIECEMGTAFINGGREGDRSCSQPAVPETVQTARTGIT